MIDRTIKIYTTSAFFYFVQEKYWEALCKALDNFAREGVDEALILESESGGLMRILASSIECILFSTPETRKAEYEAEVQSKEERREVVGFEDDE